MSLGPALSLPGENNDYHAGFIARVADSFHHVTGRSLVRDAGLDPRALGRSAWFGDFALLTHRGDAGAVLNYGNRFALKLWEMDWNSFTATPSGDTAPRNAS
ncbi:MAG TPA: MEKHLA domain-containing protein, partial [Rhizomicrobium sp.]|nr:MEKHLA domain-containing protein [Rhizomicrobium sp.]